MNELKTALKRKEELYSMIALIRPSNRVGVNRMLIRAQIEHDRKLARQKQTIQK